MSNPKHYAKIYTVEYSRVGMKPWYQRQEDGSQAGSDFTEDIRSARRMTREQAQAALRMAGMGPGLCARLMIVPHDWPEGAKKSANPHRKVLTERRGPDILKESGGKTIRPPTKGARHEQHLHGIAPVGQSPRG